METNSSTGCGVLLMGQEARAGDILAPFRALFCKVRGDTGPNGGDGGQKQQGMPNVGDSSRSPGAGLCDGGGAERRGGRLVPRGVTAPVQGMPAGWARDEEERDG